MLKHSPILAREEKATSTPEFIRMATSRKAQVNSSCWGMQSVICLNPLWKIFMMAILVVIFYFCNKLYSLMKRVHLILSSLRDFLHTENKMLSALVLSCSHGVLINTTGNLVDSETSSG